MVTKRLIALAALFACIGGHPTSSVTDNFNIGNLDHVYAEDLRAHPPGADTNDENLKITRLFYRDEHLQPALARRDATDAGSRGPYKRIYEGNPAPWPDQQNASFPIPEYKRTCATDARVALWKWRYICDRDSTDKDLWNVNVVYCIHPPPSSERCCTGAGDDGVPLMAANCLTSPLWPQSAREAASCATCDLRTNNCVYGNYAAVNNPQNVCLCQFPRCVLPEKYNPYNSTDGSVTDDLGLENMAAEAAGGRNGWVF